jgi:hypothetical protein
MDLAKDAYANSVTFSQSRPYHERIEGGSPASAIDAVQSRPTHQGDSDGHRLMDTVCPPSSQFAAYSLKAEVACSLP